MPQLTTRDSAEAYLTYIAKHWDAQVCDEYSRIFTPYQYLDNSKVEVFVDYRDGMYFVNDAGDAVGACWSHGVDVTEAPWDKIVENIIKTLEVSFDAGIIEKGCTRETLGEAMFDVISAVQAVTGLCYCKSLIGSANGVARLG